MKHTAETAVKALLVKGLTVRQIAEERGVSPQAVYKLVHRLEREGVICRVRRSAFEVVE
jgi:transposase